MPKRMLDDSLLTSPSLAECSPRAQDAFPRFILVADDFGCFDANPRVLLGRGWPLRHDVTEEEIAGWMAEYQSGGMLQLWSEGGRTYGHLVAWDGPKGQRRRTEYDATSNPKGSKRRTPAPPASFPPVSRQLPAGVSAGNARETEPLANCTETLPASFPPEFRRETDFPGHFPLPQSQSQSQPEAELQTPSRARAGRGEDTSTGNAVEVESSASAAASLPADHRTPLELVADAYERVKGSRPKWGIREEKDMRPLISAGWSPEEIATRAERAFRSTAFPRVATPAELVRHWDHFAADEPAKPDRPSKLPPSKPNPNRQLGPVKDAFRK